MGHSTYRVGCWLRTLEKEKVMRWFVLVTVGALFLSASATPAAADPSVMFSPATGDNGNGRGR